MKVTKGGGDEMSYPASEIRGGAWEELPHAPTPEARGGGREEQPHFHGVVAVLVLEGLAIPCSRSEGEVVRRYPSSKVRSNGCNLLEQP